MLIGFLAKKRHGKDTCADYLVNQFGFTKIAFADPLKKGVGELFGFSDEQLYGDQKESIDEYWGITPRLAFQYLGTDVFRNDIQKIMPNIQNQFWVRKFQRTYLEAIAKDPNARYVVSDVRFQNEVDIIHELGGTVTKIHRPNIDLIDNHLSETEIDRVKNYDHMIQNDGTIKNLHDKLDLHLDHLMKPVTITNKIVNGMKNLTVNIYLVLMLFSVWTWFTTVEQKKHAFQLACSFAVIEYITRSLCYGNAHTTIEQFLMNILCGPILVDGFRSVVPYMWLRVLVMPLNVWIIEIIQGYTLLYIWKTRVWEYTDEYAYFNGFISLSWGMFWMVLGFLMDIVI